MNFVERVGAALVAPRRALMAAEGGSGGLPDAMWLVLLKIVCTETPLLVSTLWGLIVLGPRAALTVLTTRLGAVVSIDLLLLAGAGVLVTLCAGGKRDMSRDFDLAAVAWMPVLAVDIFATLGLRLSGHEAGGILRTALWCLALAWMSAGLWLAVGVTRGRK